MLEVKNLTKWFGANQAVRGISFKVAKGEVLGFLGPNGAGKSTTMRIISGFLPATSGTASICGHDIADDPVEAKKRLGYLPENAPAYSDMTVTGFLNFVAGVRGFHGRTRAGKINETIEKYRLENVRHQPIGTLSKGYRQRVCFAQAVLHDPPVLIMDEPTDGLDPNQKFLVRNMIKEMSAEKAMVISTHILEEVDTVCTRVIIISNGMIVAAGTPAELEKTSPTGRLEDVFRKATMGEEHVLRR